ncbi:MAG: GTP-binding protein [Candidatus Heimdallarchaeota archaeon]|nr:GTP-binding protein [Candidatus Heimdallarchaeota archaeon]
MSTPKPISWLRNAKSIVLIGLDYAGKTTLLNQWTKGIAGKTTTTIGLDIEHVQLGNETFNLIDLGGQEPFRMTLWKTYAKMASAIIFVFDITDKEKVSNAIDWFWQVEEWVAEKIPILFCANKIDLKKEKGGEKEGMSLEEIVTKFELNKFGEDLHNLHSFRIFEISALTGENVPTAMDWITKKVTLESKHPSIHEIGILSQKGELLVHLSLKDNYQKNLNRFYEIVKLNQHIGITNNSTQVFERENALDIVLFTNDYYCIVIGEKEAEPKTLALTAETILSVFILQKSEGSFDQSLFEKVIRENFSKN